MVETGRKYIFDFDSTLTRVEALDVLAEMTLEGKSDRDEIVRRIQEITNLGIDGDISFTESLEQRIKLLNAHKDDLGPLVEELRHKISKSIAANKDFFEKFSDDIYVISCGFKEFIDPIVKEYNIPSERVYANTFEFDEEGNIVGFDSKNVLSQHNGKIECLKQMNLEGEVQVIGDGYSDYVMREAGIADKFFAYTENVHREKAAQNADYITPNMDEFLFVNDLPRNISYPKNRIKILLLENVHPAAFKNLSEEGFSVELVKHSIPEDELIERIKGVHVLGIRSKTQVTQKVLDAADKLMVVGAFCIGTTQIDLQYAKKKGVVVFNAPYSNTRSVVELAIGEIIMLMRSVFARSSEIHNGQWQKTAEGSREVRGKNLGIVGYGNIGKQLSILAEAVGMRVYYYDVDDKLSMGNAKKCNTLEDLLNVSDVVTLHIDDNKANKNFIGEREISQMRNGAMLINLSRGFVVDIDALANALKSGKLAGAAIDVYPEEPRSNGEFYTPLQGLKNVILTPHVGGSTEEAQRDIADFVPNKIMDYINSGNTVDAVNFPNIRLPKQRNAHRFLHIHKNVPGIMAKINEVLAKYGLNISGQYLSTDSEVGYVITDLDKEYNKDVIKALKKVENTIKFRVLY
ncbi:phosphoglycerate dehydrogenase [Zobellia galactanivorans]|uniref:D-3-phosphoglycerate dehydrogenase n=1 Tax=Zobellia galactanivorans (strain DSM 12802 / CCUG 47099 / CIP 106680 / NCIMB 13871 / Dsij) TaxID=63186 RepID=G0LCX5_ZOBGA|nr:MULTISPECIES: phosphoglycerate dehydrogenase [Zobellia]MBU3027132.1 phosphoglycerate dehydrogenase [Zobellia galactanivorans]MDO6517116.1 phosphoglycerate dehydrogenase [Zobellia uliginosa]MDO6807937.1 phosphoglycerate dehydrogenase [Zobellia galactanivorans]OWW24837.1 3-phosphoglycerate dehydrogenase [Zobellia sp. OII3]CAZ94107.1 Phosphoserine phosphatase / D-3-phosphoglycerate dehydrogenase [Zobellia galactanivorans]